MKIFSRFSGLPAVILITAFVLAAGVRLSGVNAELTSALVHNPTQIRAGGTGTPVYATGNINYVNDTINNLWLQLFATYYLDGTDKGTDWAGESVEIGSGATSLCPVKSVQAQPFQVGNSLPLYAYATVKANSVSYNSWTTDTVTVLIVN